MSKQFNHVIAYVTHQSRANEDDFCVCTCLCVQVLAEVCSKLNYFWHEEVRELQRHLQLACSEHYC